MSQKSRIIGLLRLIRRMIEVMDEATLAMVCRDQTWATLYRRYVTREELGKWRH